MRERRSDFDPRLRSEAAQLLRDYADDLAAQISGAVDDGLREMLRRHKRRVEQAVTHLTGVPFVAAEEGF